MQIIVTIFDLMTNGVLQKHGILVGVRLCTQKYLCNLHREQSQICTIKVQTKLILNSLI